MKFFPPTPTSDLLPFEREDPHINTVLNSQRMSLSPPPLSITISKKSHKAKPRLGDPEDRSLGGLVIRHLRKNATDITTIFVGFALRILSPTYQSVIVDYAAAYNRSDILEWLNLFHPDVKGTSKAVLIAMDKGYTDTLRMLVKQRKDPIPSTILLESIRFVCDHRSLANVSPEDAPVRRKFVQDIVLWAETMIVTCVHRIVHEDFQLLDQDIHHIISLDIEYKSVMDNAVPAPLDIAVMFGNIFVMQTLYDMGHQYLDGAGIISGYSTNFIPVLEWIVERSIPVRPIIHATLFYMAAHYLDFPVMEWLIKNKWTSGVEHEVCMDAASAQYVSKQVKVAKDVKKMTQYATML